MSTRLVGKLKSSDVIKGSRSTSRSNIDLREILSEVFRFDIGLTVSNAENASLILKSLLYKRSEGINYPSILLQKLLRFINFRRQVWTSSSIRVVQQHKLPVIFPYLVLGQHPLAIVNLVRKCRQRL